MLGRESVSFNLTRVAMGFRRKIDDRLIDVYHRQLERHLDDEQFAVAIQAVLDEDDKFPSIARILAAGRSYRRHERGTPYIVDGGPLSECLADIDAGRSYGGDDQFRGRTHTKPAIERLVYEDAAVTVEAVSGEGLSDRLRRIMVKAEETISRMETAATTPQPQPQPIQGEL